MVYTHTNISEVRELCLISLITVAKELKAHLGERVRKVLMH